VNLIGLGRLDSLSRNISLFSRSGQEVQEIVCRYCSIGVFEGVATLVDLPSRLFIQDGLQDGGGIIIYLKPFLVCNIE